MTESAKAKNTIIDARQRIIVALDVETAHEARRLVDDLSASVGAFKIGLQLFTSAGPAFVRELTGAGVKIFLDLKFHDIPNTVANAAIEAAKLRVWMFNVHVSGGPEMIRRTADDLRAFCLKEGIDRPELIGVTVLTSSDRDMLNSVGVGHEVSDQVLRLAKLASECGLDGVVASPLETVLIRKAIPDGRFLIVTPGIRPNFATHDDQKRVNTPSEALSAGSDYLVIGRPITAAENPRNAVEQILSEIAVHN
ncbi:MAG TPA: orotidine-5'-phosphate decarboxylase [Pyrinomonadaceae bacterium]|jgi:orotidine-5'-phosphate decarboxylase|nr:orotidine-5'-phosphate decarboxylase [Pyrinomonadaceae bacterium]